MTDRIEAAARAICAERCAVYGEPPCWRIAPDEWEKQDCDDAGGHDIGCRALALAAVKALEGK